MFLKSPLCLRKLILGGFAFESTSTLKCYSLFFDCLLQPLHKDRSMSPQFFSSKTSSWYSPHPAGTLPAKAYTDNEQLYDTGPNRKPDY